MSSISAGTTSTTTLVHSGDTTGSLVFKTNDTGSGGTTAVTIDTSQNVGIGTTSPSTTLTVNGAAQFVSTANNAGGITLGTTVSSIDWRIADSGVSTYALTFGSVSSGVTTERMRIDSSGHLLVNTTTSGGWSGDQTVSGNATNSTFAWALSGYNNTASNGGAILARVDNTSRPLVAFYYTGSTNVGNITTNGSVVTYGGTSDYRLKENIQPLTGALAKVALLKPCKFTWKNTSIEDDGFIAHELQEVHPNAVVGEKDAVNEDGSIKAQEIDPRFLIATLTAAIQELKAINDQQAATINALTARVVALENK